MDVTLCHLGFPFRAHEMVTYAPVGMLYLVAGLEQRGFRVDFRDYQLARVRNPHSPRELVRFLEGHAPVVGLGCMMKELPQAILAARLLKERRPEAFVVLGGTGPSPVARELMEAFPWVDAVATGEADQTVVELMQALTAGTGLHRIAGLYSRQGDGIVHGGERPLIEDLDALPLPAYGSMDVSGYNTVYVSGSRGCLFRCTFCDQPVFWRKRVRERSARSIFQELVALARLKPSWNVTFADNIFCSNRRALEDFAHEFRRSPLRFSFGVNQRVELVTPASTELLRGMGTRLVLFGIESGSVPVLRRIGKSFTPDQVLEALRLTADAVPFTVASFMFGYPFETLEDFVATLELVRRILEMPTRHPVVLQLHRLSPLAGTPILEEFRESLRWSPVAGVVTTDDNQDAYRLTGFEDGKALVTPWPHRTGRRLPQSVRDLVRAHPALFPSYYVYDSPAHRSKERIMTHLLDLAVAGGAVGPSTLRLPEGTLYLGEGPLRFAPRSK